MAEGITIPDVKPRVNANGCAKDVRSDVSTNPFFGAGSNPSKPAADKTVEDDADVDPHPVKSGGENHDPTYIPNAPQQVSCKCTAIGIAVIIAALLTMSLIFVGIALYSNNNVRDVEKPTQAVNTPNTSVNLVVNTTYTSVNPAVNTTYTSVNPVVNTTYTSVNPVVNTTYTSVSPVVNTTYTSVNLVVNTTYTSVNSAVNTTYTSVNPVVNTTYTSVSPVVDTPDVSDNPIVDTPHTPHKPGADTFYKSDHPQVKTTYTPNHPAIYITYTPCPAVAMPTISSHSTILPLEQTEVGLEVSTSGVTAPLKGLLRPNFDLR
ncbi:hypothetical protein Bbelb_155250 [Branchiostoma belcheri]|nr:hypothetical protein Bbelb_155250 [Branchiostoma belcheri]